MQHRRQQSRLISPHPGRRRGFSSLTAAQLPPSGRRITTKGMELVQVRSGKVALHHGYWDSTALAGQLGLLEAPQAEAVPH